VKPRPVWLGIVLIVVGVAMLLDHFQFLPMSWWLIFWASITVLSATLVVRNSRRKEGGTFWFTILFFFGLYKTLRNLGALEIDASLGFPLLLIFAGIGVAVVVVTYPSRWHLAVPAIALMGAGAAIALAELGVLSTWDVRTAISNYWPAALVLFGAALVINSGIMKKGST
jgi:hypothetical protein